MVVYKVGADWLAAGDVNQWQALSDRGKREHADDVSRGTKKQPNIVSGSRF